MMTMCIFCKIVKGEIPNYTVYEDEQVLAFLDISQVTKGHTLVIPKKHYDDFLDCDDETLTHLMKVTKKLANHIVDSTQANGVNILSNAKEAAGQTVLHFHTHIIPRYDASDACVIKFNTSEKVDLQALSNKLYIKK